MAYMKSDVVRRCDWSSCAELGKAEEYAVYQHMAKKLLIGNRNSDAIHFTLQPSSFEPVMKLGAGIGGEFAAIGLANMFNCDRTLIEVEGNRESVRMKVKGRRRALWCIRTEGRGSACPTESGWSFEHLEEGRMVR